MRRATFIVLLLVSQNALSWYPEFGNQISGTGSYDTTGHHFILIAFNRVDDCGSASLWLDKPLHRQGQSEESSRVVVNLSVDGLQSWTLNFDTMESDYWLPRPFTLNQKIPADLLKQLGSGRKLTVSGNQHEYLWNLEGSSQAMRSAYQACVD